ncbi:MAG: lysophospholipid acyltransferase family protein [Aggregatilineales bacterium]
MSELSTSSQSLRPTPATRTVHHSLRRRFLRRVGKTLQPLLTRTRVTGQEHIPPSGPLIVVGNHTAFIEGLLMILTMPWPIDLMGAGDVPLRGGFVFLQRWWGFIPINRGEIDRAGLKATAAILEGGGTIGIFPEGGIWDHKIGDARLGVAYLSQQTGTPILPIGFGGLIGAINKITHLQRPALTVNIGPVIPPVPTSDNYRERKALAQTASNQIMDAIYGLVPADDEINRLGDRKEQYAFDVQLTDKNGQSVTVPTEFAIPYGEDLSYFFHRPVLIGVVIDNLQRPAEVLRHFDTERDPARFAAALRETLQVFTREKPAFLSYRLGNKQAGHVVDGLRALEKLSEWAAERNLSMQVRPQATFTYADGRVEQLDVPGAAYEH